MRGGRNTAGIDRLYLFGVGENVGKLSGKEMLFFFGQLELRERGDAFDVGYRKDGWHWLIVIQDSKCFELRKLHPMATDIRPAAVAGSWYPSSADRLAREVDDYIGRAQVDDPGAPIAIVAPHAGLKYSGPIAAFAYRAVQHGDYDAAVLVGPSHFIGFNGVAIWPRGAWQTPFGSVQVAEDLARAITAASREIIEHPPAHGREHSLEMQ